MDPQQVKAMAFWVCLGAGVVALVAAGASTLGNPRRSPGWARSAFASMLGGVVAALIAIGLAVTLAPGSGARGCAAAFAVGVLLVPAAALVAVLRHAASSAPASEAGIPVPVLLPGIFLVGADLAAMGFLSSHYGIRAQAQWQSLVLGLALGMCWSQLCVRYLDRDRYAESVSSPLTGAFLVAVALPWTAAIAGLHFAWPSTAPWFVPFCGAGLLAGWTLALVVIALATRRQQATNSAATLLAAGVIAVALLAAAGSAQASLVHEAGLLPALAAGLLAALLTLVVAAARGTLPDSATASSADRTALDPISAVVVVFVVAGVAWMTFKLWSGLGLTVAGLGFLAALPVAAAAGGIASRRGGFCLPERAVALGGACLLLLGGMKLYQEAASFMLSGIDIADGNVTVALLMGMVVPVVLEPLLGRRCSACPAGGTTGTGLKLVGRFLACVVLGGATVVGGALYFGMDGLAAAMVGWSTWSLLAAASLAATGEEAGLLTFRALPLMPAMMALAILLTPLRDLLAAVTREQKIQAVLGLLVVSVVTLSVASLVGRRPRATAEAGVGESTPVADAAEPAARQEIV